MMKKRRKQGSAVILAAALAFSALGLYDANAAVAVDTDASCQIEVRTPEDGFGELKQIPVTVKLYKVADIDVEGSYTAAEAFQTIDLAVSSETTAEEWGEKAVLAKEIVDTAEVEVHKEADTEAGAVTFEGLETGLYLVDAQQALSDYNQYDFTPYLISLPDNHYYSSGNDDWVYELTGENAVGLKPEKTDRLGDLVINKTLDTYNATNGGATFVFQIEATKTDVDTNEVKVVYSDVVSMTFNGAGTDSITLEDIPAGANVVVTEIYSGANYTLTSEGVQNVVILADDEEGAPVAVDFANTHDKRVNGGNGVVNQFIYNSETGEWTHEATEDSTP